MERRPDLGPHLSVKYRRLSDNLSRLTKQNVAWSDGSLFQMAGPGI